MRRLWLGLPILVLAQMASAAPLQPQAQYEAAIRSFSTSPSYVLVTIIDDRIGQSRTGCTLANFVLGAMYREQKKLPSFQELKLQMLQSRDHVFHFSDPDALANARFNYTLEEMVEAQAFVLAHKDGLASGDRKLLPIKMQHSDAFACALVEQGYEVSNSDIGGLIIWK